jgi:hypothetical protein
MYRRPKFLEVLIRIREEMAREADYDTDLFTEMVRSGRSSWQKRRYSLGETQPSENEEKRRSKKTGR